MKPILIAMTFLACARAAQPDPGGDVFRSNCAFCHGMNGTGGRGPSLVSIRVSQNTPDEKLLDTIQHGISGTGMPSFDMEKDDLDALLVYIRRLSAGQPAAAEPHGDAARGKTIYASSGCAGCHRIGDAGSIYGPELTRIGAARALPYLSESIANPSADIAPEYEGVLVVTTQGKRVTGVRVNEDTFTLQLRLPDEQFALFDKTELLSIKPLTKSLMPVFKLSDHDRDDLLAYLLTLRGEASNRPADETRGVH
jgi:putative heme-binding domain-containing protein